MIQPPGLSQVPKGCWLVRSSCFQMFSGHLLPASGSIDWHQLVVSVPHLMLKLPPSFWSLFVIVHLGTQLVLIWWCLYLRSEPGLRLWNQSKSKSQSSRDIPNILLYCCPLTTLFSEIIYIIKLETSYTQIRSFKEWGWYSSWMNLQWHDYESII